MGSEKESKELVGMGYRLLPMPEKERVVYCYALRYFTLEFCLTLSFSYDRITVNDNVIANIVGGRHRGHSNCLATRMGKRRITIKQVAQEAEVSTQTVSRVINQRPDVSPETRQRILNIIDRLGYHPSAIARSLIQQRSYTLGVVIAGLKYIGPSMTLNGIV